MTAKLLCISKFKQLAIKSKVTRYASKRQKEHCKLYLDKLKQTSTKSEGFFIA